MAIPNAPSNLIAIFVAPSGYSCTWEDNSDNETGFELQLRNITLDGQWALIDPNPAANDEFYDFGQGYVVGPNELQLRIRAVNGDGESAWAESNIFTIQPASTDEIFIINSEYNQRNGVTIGGYNRDFRLRYENSVDVFNEIIVDRFDDYDYYDPNATGGT